MFDWREPDEKRLRKRCALELNWAPSTAAAVLDPVFKRWAERKAGRQRRVDAFFDSYHSVECVDLRRAGVRQRGAHVLYPGEPHRGVHLPQMRGEGSEEIIDEAPANNCAVMSAKP